MAYLAIMIIYQRLVNAPERLGGGSHECFAFAAYTFNVYLMYKMGLLKKTEEQKSAEVPSVGDFWKDV